MFDPPAPTTLAQAVLDTGLIIFFDVT